ncbi:hypothetical protein FLGE108171_05405 [Flavobacterium gelidilacus]|uniref:hypothetical protein n=1 Tax=Flavobacterium gelidilacus TaxID=206041 RepID=UPI00047905EA|nr:hypothetical protein [Flavobacterium gelidilacus]
MTKKDFFRIIIKLFGLYSMIISLFTFLPRNISTLSIYKEEIWMMFVILGSTLLMITFFLILLFKTDFIINKLSLDKGYDDDKIIFGNFNNEEIFKFAILLIGGFLLVDNFPRILFEIINIFKTKSSNNSIYGYEVDYFNFIVGIINFMLGLILITNYKQVSNFLDKK